MTRKEVQDYWLDRHGPFFQNARGHESEEVSATAYVGFALE